MKKIVATIVMGALLFTGVCGYAWWISSTDELYDPGKWNLSGVILISTQLRGDNRRILLGIDLATGEMLVHDRDAYPILGDGEYPGLVAEERDGVAYIYSTDGREMWDLLFEYPVPSGKTDRQGNPHAVYAYMGECLYYYQMEEDALYIVRDDMQGNTYRYEYLSRESDTNTDGYGYVCLSSDGKMVQAGDAHDRLCIQYPDGTVEEVLSSAFYSDGGPYTVRAYGWATDEVLLVRVWSADAAAEGRDGFFWYHAESGETKEFQASPSVVDAIRSTVSGGSILWGRLTFGSDGKTLLCTKNTDDWQYGPILLDTDTGRCAAITELYQSVRIPGVDCEANFCGMADVIWIP